MYNKNCYKDKLILLLLLGDTTAQIVLLYRKREACGYSPWSHFSYLTGRQSHALLYTFLSPYPRRIEPKSFPAVTEGRMPTMKEND
jgi:hypothetical protein